VTAIIENKARVLTDFSALSICAVSRAIFAAAFFQLFGGEARTAITAQCLSAVQ
jgi:hypothetical protein